LDKVSLSEFVKSLPNGLDTQLDSRTVPLSGGQKQRLHIARELFFKSNVLFFDEPTSALDRQNVNRFSSLLRELRGASTCIIVTHDTHVAKHADSIFSLEGGILQHLESLETKHDV
jgi:ABC-type bacteriocin/lantibiotic exporter with double-glycine peptidase domain